MSLLSDTLVSGGVRLYLGRGGKSSKDVKKWPSQGPVALLTPLIHLVKDPLRALGSCASFDTAYAASEKADRRQLLYLRLKEAETYEDWTAAATELDTLEGNDVWKLEDESPEYNHALLKARLEEVDNVRISCDVKEMVHLIRTSLTRDLGGMGDLRLYKHSHIGTKKLIERYNESVMQLLAALPEVAAKQGASCSLKLPLVLDEMISARQSYGRTALLLSGGGTFGMNHIGVIKCLWEQCLLPRIISGTSAGSIVCAVLCTKTDAEIPRMLEEFCFGDLAVFDEADEPENLVSKVIRFLTQGALFDIAHLERVMKIWLGDMTFQESYNRTHRVLNITVSSASMYELPRLLNYVTAPDVMIWSAVCASCSVPFVFSAASLKAKGRTTGKEVPWDPTPNTGWIDGSVDNDLPMTRLAEMFNVNHFIVSQVNPHVVPFLIKEEEAIGAEALQESAGSGWMQDFASFAKDEALHRLDMLIEMGVLTNVVTKARSVLSQRYSGDITIFPAISYENFPKVLSNPTTDYMEHCLLTGEKATWPKMPRIRNHVAVELALDESINKIRPLVHFSQLQSNRRLEHFASTGGRVSQARRLHRSAPFGSDTALSTPTLKRSSALPRHFTVRNKIRLRPTSDPHLRSRSSKFDVGSFGFSKSFSKVHVTSSTDPDGSSTGEDFSSNDESDTTEFVSSPSPSHSHLQLPFIFPSASESSIATTTFGHQSQFSYNLNMTPAAPSSPEVRYRRLFHPPASTIIQDSSPILQQEIKNPTVSTKDLPFLQQTGTLSQDLQPSNLAPNDSLNEYTIQAFTQPTFTPVLSLRSTRAGANISRQQQKETTEVGKYAEEIRGGIAQSWPLDNSGFRAMGLRKKPSGDSDRAN